MEQIITNLRFFKNFSKQCYYILSVIIFIQCNQQSGSSPNHFSSANNLAFNNGNYKYPTPVESDNGWGGGSWKWHIVDGLRIRGINAGWKYGLAFTGGKYDYLDTCGWRQMTIDFGKNTSFNRTIVTFMYEIPDNYYILTWNKQKNIWDTCLSVTQKRRFLNTGKNKELIHRLNKEFGAIEYLPVEDTFTTVNSCKIRFLFNNCDMEHGWVNEFEVYCDKPNERPMCLLFKQ